MSRTSRLGLAAAVTSLALMISACGGDDSATADAAEGNQNENSTVERGEDWRPFAVKRGGVVGQGARALVG